tara:strand:+ start:389 stop:1561 length:1173 start_codon:yes stop_codon:yes gene_type:complete
MSKNKTSLKKIIYGKQFIDQKDINSVKNALTKSLLTTGPLTNQFEKKISNYLKVKYSHTCNSGTSAILLALLSIGVKKGDNIIVPSINFIAAANMVKFLGANVFFADVNPETAQSEPQNFHDCITANKLKKIKAFITMYNGGYPRNIIKFWKFRNKYKCYFIEDACHAFGSSYSNNNKILKIGSCVHSDICTFSLHPLKTITTFEGGIITTKNSKISNKIKLYRSHGIERSKKYWEYNVTQIGLNFRLSDVASSLGISQLKKIRKFLKYRRYIYNYYKRSLHEYKNIIKIIKPELYTLPSFHLVMVKINFKKLNLDKDQFFSMLNKKNIFCQFHYMPSYKFKIFNQIKKLKGAEEFYKNGISLPVHMGLKNKDLLYIVKIIKEIISKQLK